jgi:hypothetical protein
MLTRLFLCMMVFSLFLPSSSPAQDTKALEAEAALVIQAFAKELKAELRAGLKAGGPVKAIEVCREKAPQIAKRISAKTGWTIGRTSLRLRNPNNAPDAWEQGVLENFQIQAKEGADSGGLVFSDVIQEEGKTVFRLMKGIKTGGLCLKCHGSQLSPQLKERLVDLYPYDRATGFKAGDLRGAFTLEKQL